jgi:hypothetical protein
MFDSINKPVWAPTKADLQWAETGKKFEKVGRAGPVPSLINDGPVHG